MSCDPIMRKLRNLPDGECWPCHVGSGECHEPAVEVYDDGAGGEFLICRSHLPGLYQLAKVMEAMDEETIAKMTRLVKEAE